MRDGIHFAAMASASGLCALEDHVLHEVREAVLFGNFAAEPLPDPQPTETDARGA